MKSINDECSIYQRKRENSYCLDYAHRIGDTKLVKTVGYLRIDWGKGYGTIIFQVWNITIQEIEHCWTELYQQ